MYKLITFLLMTSTCVGAEKLSFQQSLNLSTDRLTAIEIINGAGDIIVTTNQGNEILVNAIIVSDKYPSMERFREVFDRDMVFTIVRESEYAVLRGHAKPNLRKSPDIQIHLNIQIPVSMDVKIDDGSGSINVSDVGGNLDIDDGSGHIIVNGIGGSLDIDDGSGDIEISHAKGTIKIDDGSGDITLTDSDGDVKLEDGSGDITIRTSHGNVEIDDGSGDIHLSNIDGSAKIKDGSGSIYIDSLGGSLTIKSAGSGKVIIDGENRTKEFN